MKLVISLLIAGIFTGNITTYGLLGLEELSENKGMTMSALLKRCGVQTALLLISTALFYPLHKYLLLPLGVDYLSPLSAVLIICGVIFAVWLLSKKLLPSFAEYLGKSGLLSCSPVILGACLFGAYGDIVTGFLTAILYAVALGVGASLVAVIFHTVSERLETAPIPSVLKGLPICLLIAFFISLAFGGFAGV